MRARTAIAWTAHRIRLAVFGWGLTAMLACVALSACTSSGSPRSSVTVLSPSVSGSVSGSATISGSASGGASASTSAGSSTSPSASASASPRTSPSASASASSQTSPSASATPSSSPTPSSSASSEVPNGAPVTGGGGTADFQDAGLAVLGGAAIVAGLGGIVYRRKMARNR